MHEHVRDTRHTTGRADRGSRHGQGADQAMEPARRLHVDVGWEGRLARAGREWWRHDMRRGWR
eukprot:7297898-Prymnesium_polylepis.1